jgi:alpha-tubulin suppressor-like RCC1 family protein
MKKVLIIILCLKLFISLSLFSQRFAETYTSNFFITDDGNLWCWGNNNYLHLGEESIYQNKPIIFFPNTKWKAVTATNGNHYGIKSDGTLWTWYLDYNKHRYEGSNNKERKILTVRRVGSDNKWKYITSDGYVSIGLKTDGTLWTWGQNMNGQLGDGTTQDKLIPTKMGKDDNWKSVSLVGTLVYAIKNNGTLWAWGTNYFGLFGKKNKSIFPVQIDKESNWKEIESGGEHILALKLDGSLWSWGDNRFGRLGLGNLKTEYQVTPMRIGSDNDWIQISAGGGNSYAIKSNGSIWSWGDNRFWTNGRTMQNFNTNIPTKVENERNWKKVFANAQTIIGIKSDNSIWIWGTNDFGKLGIGKDPFKKSPIKVMSDIGWKEVVNIGSRTYGIKRNGTLWAWGHVDIIEPEIPTSTFSIPKQVGDENNWKSIEVSGFGAVLALKTNGTLWTWKYQDSTKFDINTSKYHFKINQIGKENDWEKVFGGEYNIYAIQTNGSLWGTNNHWDLINYEPNYNLTQIGNDSDWSSVGAGYHYALGLKKNGTLWSWGSNSDGCLGLGSKNPSLKYALPQQIGYYSNWSSISTNQNFIFALNSNGRLWNWGSKFFYNLYPGHLFFNAPSELTSLNNIKEVKTNFNFACAIKNDGTLWTWGYNDYGNLGDGTRVDNISGVQVGEDRDWNKLCSSAGYSTFVIKRDGSLWSWGNNIYGQLGIGEVGFSKAPTLLFNDSNLKNYNLKETEQEDNVLLPPVKRQSSIINQLKNGLVAFYPFNGNANDASGNGNNGVVLGATLTTNRFGTTNSSYYFSSQNCSPRIEANINTSSIKSSISISIWVKQDGTGCALSPRILDFESSPIDGPGQLQWMYGYQNKWGIGHLNSNGIHTTDRGRDDKSFSTGSKNWTHLVYINDGTTSKFYQDGRLLDVSANVNGRPILARNLTIGRMNHPAFDAFNGNIDDLGIWNRALTSQEIQYLFKHNYQP